MNSGSRLFAGPALLSLTLLVGCSGPSLLADDSGEQSAELVTEAVVKRALIDELGIAASAIGVRVDSGQIVLTGFVGRDDERRRAVAAVRRLDRVGQIDDRLEVK